MTETDTTAGMSDADLAAYYDVHGLADFKGGEEIQIEPEPKDAIVSVRFAAGELNAVERQAEAAGMKLTAYIRASALSSAQVVDLDRLRKVAAKIVADSEEMGEVFNLRTSVTRNARYSTSRTATRQASAARTTATSARTGRSVKSSKRTAAKTTVKTTVKVVR